MMPAKKPNTQIGSINNRIPVLREVVEVNKSVRFITPEASAQIKHKLAEIGDKIQSLKSSLEHYEYLAKGFRQAGKEHLATEMENAFQANGAILLKISESSIAEIRAMADELETKIQKNIYEGEFK